MQTIRLGTVRYLNTEPMVAGLTKAAGVELFPAAPSALIELLTSGRVDVALASLVDAARSSTPVALLDAGVIASDGPTLTVRLFSAVEPAAITRVHADTESHTSVVLCRVLLDALFGVRPEVIDFDVRERVERPAREDASPVHEAWPETVLLIGDKVIADHPPTERYPHQLDLGGAWREWTGLPFVYACWMCLADRRDDPAVRLARDVLERQRLHNATRLDRIVVDSAPEHRWPIGTARTYVRDHLRFAPDDPMRRGVQRFIDEASARGLVPAAALDWGAPPALAV